MSPMLKKIIEINKTIAREDIEDFCGMIVMGSVVIAAIAFMFLKVSYY